MPKPVQSLRLVKSRDAMACNVAQGPLLHSGNDLTRGNGCDAKNSPFTFLVIALAI